MSDKAHYALVVLLAVGALSFLLRALPFLLFGGRKEPPKTVTYIGRVLSPAAIAMLVIYCYADAIAQPAQGGVSAVAAPCLAGALTVALQLWRRNPLVSILSGTALYMVLVHL